MDGERGRVKEQSHKSEMRAALQGDFERLRARREDGATPVAEAPPVEDPVPVLEIVQPADPAEPVVTDPVTAVEPPPPSSWLDRMRNRR